MLVQTHTSYFMFNKRMEKGKLKTESYCVEWGREPNCTFCGCILPLWQDSGSAGSRHLLTASGTHQFYFYPTFPAVQICLVHQLTVPQLKPDLSLTNSSSLRGVCLLIKRIQKHLPYSRQVNTTIILSLDSLQPSPQISFTVKEPSRQHREAAAAGTCRMFFPFTQNRNFNN